LICFKVFYGKTYFLKNYLFNLITKLIKIYSFTFIYLFFSHNYLGFFLSKLIFKFLCPLKYPQKYCVLSPSFFATKSVFKAHFISAKFSCNSVPSFYFIIAPCHKPLCEETRKINKYQTSEKLMIIPESHLKKTNKKNPKHKKIKPPNLPFFF